MNHLNNSYRMFRYDISLRQNNPLPSKLQTIQIRKCMNVLYGQYIWGPVGTFTNNLEMIKKLPPHVTVYNPVEIDLNIAENKILTKE